MFVKFLNQDPDREESEEVQSLLIEGAGIFLGDIGLLFPKKLPVHLFVIYTSTSESDIENFKTNFMVMN